MSSPHLESSRTFVTQLFNALGAPASDEQDTSTRYDSSHPLEDAGTKLKHQLLALHVVFPNEMLPALDLLDRGMVTRLCIRRDQENAKGNAAAQHTRKENNGNNSTGPAEGNVCGGPIDNVPIHFPSPSTGLDPTDGSQTNVLKGYEPHSKSAQSGEDAVRKSFHATPGTTLDTVYYIRSTQQRSSRFSTSYDTLTFYECRLNAWHCSCPAFVFSAFPLQQQQQQPEAMSPTLDTYNEETTTILKSEWDFGGFSQDADISPACKHLLACVLVEKCADLFGGCVEERVVDVEEAAGWAAGWGD